MASRPARATMALALALAGCAPSRAIAKRPASPTEATRSTRSSAGDAALEHAVLELVNRHRLIRRGITYGEMLPEGVTEDDGKDRGVIFMTVQASLARQFEFVQAQWANTGNPFRLGDDQDPIIGPMDSSLNKMTVPGWPPFFCGPLSRVVTVRGGEYYFAPGINGLRHLAAG